MSDATPDLTDELRGALDRAGLPARGSLVQGPVMPSRNRPAIEPIPEPIWARQEVRELVRRRNRGEITHEAYLAELRRMRTGLDGMAEAASRATQTLQSLQMLFQAGALTANEMRAAVEDMGLLPVASTSPPDATYTVPSDGPRWPRIVGVDLATGPSQAHAVMLDTEGRVLARITNLGHAPDFPVDQAVTTSAPIVVPCQVFDPRVLVNLPTVPDDGTIEAFAAAMLAAATPEYRPMIEAVVAAIHAGLTQHPDRTGLEPTR